MATEHCPQCHGCVSAMGEFCARCGRKLKVRAHPPLPYRCSLSLDQAPLALSASPYNLSGCGTGTARPGSWFLRLVAAIVSILAMVLLLGSALGCPAGE